MKSVKTESGTSGESIKIPLDLLSESFYFGFVIPVDVDASLEKNGNYAIYGAEVGDRERTFNFFLAYKASSQCIHVKINVKEGTGPSQNVYYFDEPKFKEKTFSHIRELITYCLDTQEIPLKEPARRPSIFIRNEKVHIKNKVGEGNFCYVNKAVLVGKNNILKNVAIKVSKAAVSLAEYHAEQKEMMKEISTLSGTLHVNIIRFYGVLCDVPPLRLVMEYCPGGSLSTHLQEQRDHIKLGERVLFLFETSRGMEYLETVGIVHRDLAARNCLIALDSTVKIGDFGLSVSVQELEGEKISRNFKAPIRLLSPETIEKKPAFSHKSDVWAYGMLAWEIFSNGQKPWADDEVKVIANNIKTGRMPSLPSSMPHEIKEIVKSCWNREVDARSSFYVILHKIHKVMTTKYPPPQPQDRTTAKLKGVYVKSVDDFNPKARSPKGKKKKRRIYSLSEADETPGIRNRKEVSQCANTTASSSSGKDSLVLRRPRPVRAVRKLSKPNSNTDKRAERVCRRKTSKILRQYSSSSSPIAIVAWRPVSKKD